MPGLQTIPLLRFHAPQAVFAWQDGHAISAGRFLTDAIALAERLPALPYLLNLCAGRYHFAVGFAAALLRGQISLLPPNQTPDFIDRLSQRYPGLYCLTDGADDAGTLQTVPYPDLSGADLLQAPMPEIPAQQVAAILFTSGSTGDPLPHAKTWGALARAITSGANRIGILGRSDLTLLGTVPPQHMFGFEVTVMYPMQGGVILHAAKPFFPADVAAGLESIPGARALVTTPVHLRALLASGIRLPELELMICATAPLPRALAVQAETKFGAPLHEIYGSTETGQIATRRTAATEEWRTLDGVSLRQQGETAYVSGGHVAGAIALNDITELSSPTHFLLHGRTSDLVNIAGKRTSLASLNHHLNDIEGVQDGVFFIPDEAGDVTARLAAFAVAPGLDASTILKALRQRIDPAFLPRPLYKVDALPRNSTGKLSRASLEMLLQQTRRNVSFTPIPPLAPPLKGGENSVAATFPPPLQGEGWVTNDLAVVVGQPSQMASSSISGDGLNPANGQSGMNMLTVEFPANHPCGAGHFPGNPIIPGALLLDEVLSAIGTRLGRDAAAWQVKSAKFPQPVRPGDKVRIGYTQTAHGEIRFECAVAGNKVLSGIASSCPVTAGGSPS